MRPFGVLPELSHLEAWLWGQMLGPLSQPPSCLIPVGFRARPSAGAGGGHGSGPDGRRGVTPSVFCP